MIAAKLPAAVWQTYSCGLGSKGPRWYQWAWIGLDSPERTNNAVYSALIRRSGEGTLAYYLTCTDTAAGLPVLIAVAGRRWMIEESFQVGKDQFGLDEYQVRSWDGWHRHTTLAMIALAVTVAATAGDQPEPALTAHQLTDPKLLTAPSLNECRRIAAIVLAAKHVGQQWIDHLEHWSQQF